jgi:hypothetical protein
MNEQNQLLEGELRQEWVNWQNNANEDDQMSFIDYAMNVGYFKDYTIEVVTDRYGDYELLFKK